MNSPTLINSLKVYSCNAFDVVKDLIKFDNGADWNYSYIQARDGVCIVAIDKKDNIVLINEYRYPVRKMVLSIPAGGIEIDDSPLATAQKELKEEAGIQASKWDLVGDFYPSPGNADYKGIIYLARELSHISKHVEAYEQIEVVKVSFNEAVEKIYNGEINDAWAIIPILMVQNYLHNQST